MRKYLVGFIIGIVVSACIFYPLLKIEQTNKYEFGKNQGFTNGLHYSTESLGKHFSKPPKNVKYETLYSVKTTDVVVFKKDGVNTIGIYE